MLPPFTSSTINVHFSLLHEINHATFQQQCKSLQTLMEGMIQQLTTDMTQMQVNNNRILTQLNATENYEHTCLTPAVSPHD